MTSSSNSSSALTEGIPVQVLTFSSVLRYCTYHTHSLLHMTPQDPIWLNCSLEVLPTGGEGLSSSDLLWHIPDKHSLENRNIYCCTSGHAWLMDQHHHLTVPSHELTSLSCWSVTQLTGLWRASEVVECYLKQTNKCLCVKLALNENYGLHKSQLCRPTCLWLSGRV